MIYVSYINDLIHVLKGSLHFCFQLFLFLPLGDLLQYFRSLLVVRRI